MRAFGESAAPREYSSHGIGRSRLSVAVFVVVTGNGTVSRFVFVIAVGRNEYRGHHRERAESRRDHIAHYVAVVVLARPYHAAVTADYSRYRVVDKGVEIGYARLFELLLVFLVVYLLEDILEPVVVGLGYRVLGRKPEILLSVQRVVETASRKAGDAVVRVMHAQYYAACF